MLSSSQHQNEFAVPKYIAGWVDREEFWEACCRRGQIRARIKLYAR